MYGIETMNYYLFYQIEFICLFYIYLLAFLLHQLLS